MKIPAASRSRPLLFTAAVMASLLPVRLSAIMAGSSDSAYTTDSPSARVTTAFSGVGTVNGCTCTAISSNSTGTWVLTAAHVIGASKSVTVTFYVGAVPYSYTTSNIYVDSSYNATTHDSDVALVYIPSGISNLITTYSLDTGLTAGQTVYLVGYGDSGYGNVGRDTSYGRAFRVGENVVDSLEYFAITDTTHTSSVFYAMDFDDPSTVGQDGGSLGNKIETTLCEGDSGGPAFVLIDGKYYIVGVNTLISSATDMGKFGTSAYGIDIYSVYSWMDSTVASVPEPSDYAFMLGLGALVPLAIRRRTLRAKR